MKLYKVKIKTKLSIIVISILTIAMIFILIAFSLFFRPYHVSQGIDILKSTYKSINFENQSLNSLISQFEIYEQKDELNFIIANEKEYLYSTNRWYRNQPSIYMANESNSQKDIVFSEMISSKIDDKIEVKQIFDSNSNLNFINLVSVLYVENDKYTFIIEKSISNLNQVVFTNLTIIIICMIPIYFLSILFIAFLSDIFTAPITDLIKRTTNISNLMFNDVVYKSPWNDEISELGNTMIIMSQKLKENTERLDVANKKLEAELSKKNKEERARKQFISSASHELKTPITVIMGSAEALKSNMPMSKKEKYIDKIISESKEMNLLVNDLINAMKAQSTELSIEKVDLISLVEANINRYSDILSKYHFEFHNEVHSGIIMADKKKINTVIDNLISNAIRYVDDNNRISIFMYYKDDKLVLKIYNTCYPLLLEDKNLIWNSFFKVDESRTREKGGSGLGLYITKGIIDSHKFNIYWNNVDRGVEFVIEF